MRRSRFLSPSAERTPSLYHCVDRVCGRSFLLDRKSKAVFVRIAHGWVEIVRFYFWLYSNFMSGPHLEPSHHTCLGGRRDARTPRLPVRAYGTHLQPPMLSTTLPPKCSASSTHRLRPATCKPPQKNAHRQPARAKNLHPSREPPKGTYHFCFTKR